MYQKYLGNMQKEELKKKTKTNKPEKRKKFVYGSRDFNVD